MLQENYNILKEQYPKSLIMIKAGNFFECLNDDAKVMNNVFDYKIIRLKNYDRVGFPKNKINYITGILTNKEINYLIFEDGNVTKEKFKSNKYSDYIDNIDLKDDSTLEDFYEKRLNIELALKKIKMINNELNKNVDNPKIIDILNEIERVICKINL